MSSASGAMFFVTKAMKSPELWPVCFVVGAGVCLSAGIMTHHATNSVDVVFNKNKPRPFLKEDYRVKVKESTH